MLPCKNGENISRSIVNRHVIATCFEVVVCELEAKNELIVFELIRSSLSKTRITHRGGLHQDKSPSTGIWPIWVDSPLVTDHKNQVFRSRPLLHAWPRPLAILPHRQKHGRQKGQRKLFCYKRFLKNLKRMIICGLQRFS